MFLLFCFLNIYKVKVALLQNNGKLEGFDLIIYKLVFQMNEVD